MSPNLDALKDAINKAWNKVLTPEVVKKATASVKERLRKCVATGGFQFDK